MEIFFSLGYYVTSRNKSNSKGFFLQIKRKDETICGQKDGRNQYYKKCPVNLQSGVIMSSHIQLFWKT